MKQSPRIRLSPKEMGRLRIRVYERSGGLCERILDNGTQCGRRACWDWDEWNHGELHHVIHRSQGGDDSEENCQWWCRICHDDIHNNRIDGKFQP